MLKFRNLHIAILTLLLVCACAHDEIGDSMLEQSEITFAASSAKTTRAGEVSLANYVQNFRLYGKNTKGLVFDNYVLWQDNGSSQSNSAGWEYVGNYTAVDISRPDGAVQGVKFWDYSTSNYIFWAVADATKGKFAETNGTVETFTTAENVTPENAATLFFTKPTVVEKAQYDLPVLLQFMKASSRVRFAFYETVPGYKVKNVTFTDAETPVTSCTVAGKFITSGKLRLTYDNTNLKVSTGYAETPATEDSHAFGTLQYTDGVLSTNSAEATYAGVADDDYYTSILPYTDNDAPLTLTLNYILVADDNSGHEIDIKAATATIPVEYCKWESNHSYTYLFKITDSELRPITFDAYCVVDNSSDNQQGTITTMGDYNITTYQAGSTNENGIGYEAGTPVDVKIINRTTDALVTLAASSADYIKVYLSTSTEELDVDDDTTTPLEVSYENGTATFTPSTPDKLYRIEYWHKEGEAEAARLAVKMLKVEDETPTE